MTQEELRQDYQNNFLSKMTGREVYPEQLLFNDIWHWITTIYTPEIEKRVREEVLNDIFLANRDSLTPDYILDSSDGRIRKAYERLMTPIDLTGTSQSQIKDK